MQVLRMYFPGKNFVTNEIIAQSQMFWVEESASRPIFSGVFAGIRLLKFACKRKKKGAAEKADLGRYDRPF